MAEIFRRIKNQNYTVMCNHHLQNDRLSLKAMGLMSKILSLPDDWNYSVRGMTAVCKDGYESVRTAFLELEREGYIKAIHTIKSWADTMEYNINNKVKEIN